MTKALSFIEAEHIFQLQVQPTMQVESKKFQKYQKSPTIIYWDNMLALAMT